MVSNKKFQKHCRFKGRKVTLSQKANTEKGSDRIIDYTPPICEDKTYDCYNKFDCEYASGGIGGRGSKNPF